MSTIWPLYAFPPILAFGGVVLHASCSARSGLWGRVLYRGSTTTPTAALTFDDGPTPGSTDRVLDILAARQVPATFFVIGRNVVDHPELIRRVDAEGHLLANHSYDHPHHGYLGGREYWVDQLKRTNDVIFDTTSRRPTLFRPPMGVRTPRMMSAARRVGLSVVTWTRRAMDGLPTTPAKIRRRLSPVSAGDLFVLHDGTEPGGSRDPSATIQVLPDIIRMGTDAGFRWVRVDELFGV